MTGKAAKVSLIVPVYNVEAYLGKCLESCSAQTLNDLEIICVDDGSTDNSGKILDEYVKEESRAVVIHKENGGVSSARNTGLKAASGEWIMFLDADDYINKHACERVWLESREERTDIIVFSGNFFPRHPESDYRKWLDSVLHSPQIRFYEFKPSVLFDTPGARPFIWHQAFSSELLKNNGILFNENIKVGEDNLFQFMVFPKAKYFSFLPDVLYHYRIERKGSAMKEVNAAARLTDHINIIDLIAEYWNQQGIMKKYGTEFLMCALDYTVPNIMKAEEKNRKEFAMQLINSMQNRQLVKYSEELPLEGRKLWECLYSARR